MKKNTGSLLLGLGSLMALIAVLFVVGCEAPIGSTSSDNSIAKAARGAWAPNVAYTVGDTVTYAGITYTCRQSHTSEVGWEPPNVLALWLPGSTSATPTPAGTPTPTPTATPTPTTGGVTRPSEVPSDQWADMVTAASKLGMPADFERYIAAVDKHESTFGAGLAGSVSAADGLMQVQAPTRNQYLGSFSSTFGHSYNDSAADQICMGALILKDMIVNYAGGSYLIGAEKYNGGPNYVPGSVDEYGRPIYAQQYGEEVMAYYRAYGGTHS